MDPKLKLYNQLNQHSARDPSKLKKRTEQSKNLSLEVKANAIQKTYINQDHKVDNRKINQILLIAQQEKQKQAVEKQVSKTSLDEAENNLYTSINRFTNKYSNFTPAPMLDQKFDGSN